VFNQESRALGSGVRISVLHDDQAVAARALAAAFAELELAESTMSLYLEDSQLSRLNRDGVVDRPHPYLRNVLVFAGEFSGRTAGAFDVTVQPLWSVYRDAFNRGTQPDPGDLAAARSAVG
jgi:thiamine biosynthesis lipoprotein